MSTPPRPAPPAPAPPPSLDRLGDPARLRVLVLGDLIADRYVRGHVERTSPEAPVPVVLWQHEDLIAGGAANVAANIRAAGARADCVGVAGDDADGHALRGAMERAGLDVSGVVTDPARPTTVKTRITCQGQQMLRLDRERADPAPPDVEDRLLAAFRERLPGAGAVVLSDYGKGVLTPRVLAAALSAAADAGIPLFVDPKGRDYARYRGCHGLTPNCREAAEAAGLAPGEVAKGDAALAEAAAAIRAATGCALLIVTRGADGLALFEGRVTEVGAEHDAETATAPLLLPTFAREVFDVTGAGDTFVAFLALATAAGLTAAEAAHVANAAAGVTVGKAGAATVSPSELRAALLGPDAAGPLARKLVSVADLPALGARLRAAGRRVVFTNGCFDFLHAGHVAFLQEARALGDALVLATNTDPVIARLKGPGRPVIAQQQRLSLLAALEAVDHVVAFDDDTPHAVLAALRPDILVKGDNYADAEVEGHELVRAYGGEIRRLPVMTWFSTADMVDRRKP